MRESLGRKGLVVGIIVLFIGTSVTSSISVHDVKIDNIDINSDESFDSSSRIDWWPMFHPDIQRTEYSKSDAPTELRPGDFMIMRPIIPIPRVVLFHVMIYVDDNGPLGTQRWVHSWELINQKPGVSISYVPGFLFNAIFWKEFRYYYVETAEPWLRERVVELLTTKCDKETSWGQQGWLGIEYQDQQYQYINNWNPNDDRDHADVFYCSELLWAVYMNLTNGHLNIADKALNYIEGTEWGNTLWYDVFGEENETWKWENDDDIDVKEFPVTPDNDPFILI